MKKFIISLCAVAALAACETKEQETVAGAAAGGLIGAAIGDREGALIGTAAGAIIGANAQTGARPNCVYQRPDGTRYNDVCPEGY